MSKTHIETQSNVYRDFYKEAVQFRERAVGDFYWTQKEIRVQDDIQDILVRCTDAERKAVLYLLKIFSKYEVEIGNEFWSGRFKKIFGRHELQTMAAAFSQTELCVHLVFYNRINELLNVDDSFYDSYLQDPVLVDRLAHIDSLLNHEDDLVSLGAFTFMEGVSLFSLFAFLKHFQANGKNKIANIVAGINYSSREEDLHATAAAWAFKELLSQRIRLNGVDTDYVYGEIKKAGELVLEHEYRIIDNLFSFGEISGITSDELKTFVDHRLSLCLANLGIGDTVKNAGSIGEWYYGSITGYTQVDFFVARGREYNRRWNKDEFNW